MTGPSTEDRLQIYELYARYSWALDTELIEETCLENERDTGLFKK